MEEDLIGAVIQCHWHLGPDDLVIWMQHLLLSGNLLSFQQLSVSTYSVLG